MAENNSRMDEEQNNSPAESGDGTETPDKPDQNKSPYSLEPEFKLGEGKISGVISAFLGILSLLAVFCFWFPELLTNQEINEGYQPYLKILRHVLF